MQHKAVVPEPIKQSKTKSPSFELALTNFLINLIGLVVECNVFSFS